LEESFDIFLKEMGEEDEIPSKTLGIRIQGKIASKMSGKSLAKQVVDGPTSDIIDNCYRIAKLYLGNKKDAEKVMKNIIKIVVKIAILYRNNCFTAEELKTVEKFQSKFKTISKSIISFYEVDFTYDSEYLNLVIKDSQELLDSFVRSHLTEKSMKRIEHVYNLYSDKKLLDAVFESGSKYRPHLGAICHSLNQLIDNGEI
jgi:transcription termination factor NusB